MSIDLKACTHLVTAPREHRQWHWDRDVDTNLTDVDFDLELAGSGTGLSENGSSVAISVIVDNVNAVVKTVSLQDDQDRTKDLLPVNNSQKSFWNVRGRKTY